EEAFRADARAWLEANVPREPRPESADLTARRAYDMAWQRRMYDAGWAGINWPKEYGGRGATLMEQLIWYEEYARVGAPDVTTGFVGLKHAGPTLIACGSEEQKAYHLPRSVRGDVVWCHGFSEPNAGSDLASLQTRAEIVGDHLVVNGQKIWTSFGHVAEFQELLVRTDPNAARPHAGITWVICPMDAPGLDIRPIKTLAGNSDFCEVFYDNVRIPLQRRRQADRRLARRDGDAQLRARHRVHVGAGAPGAPARRAGRGRAHRSWSRRAPGARRRRDRAPPRARRCRGGGDACHDLPQPQL